MIRHFFEGDTLKCTLAECDACEAAQLRITSDEVATVGEAMARHGWVAKSWGQLCPDCARGLPT